MTLALIRKRLHPRVFAERGNERFVQCVRAGFPIVAHNRVNLSKASAVDDHEHLSTATRAGRETDLGAARLSGSDWSEVRPTPIAIVRHGFAVARVVHARRVMRAPELPSRRRVDRTATQHAACDLVMLHNALRRAAEGKRDVCIVDVVPHDRNVMRLGAVSCLRQWKVLGVQREVRHRG